MEQKAKDLLKEYTCHKVVELTERGNTAIFAALYCARKLRLDKKTVLIPNQGGWLTYRKYPKMLGLSTKEIKTDSGLINPSLLRKETGCCALLYANPAGYFADQPIKDIYDACNGNCAVIVDVTGCLGDKALCVGKYADIMVGSFGKWKPVNLGYGGFVSFKKEEDHQKTKEIFNTTHFDESRLEELYEKLKGCRSRLDDLYRVCVKVKKELRKYDIIHPDKKGINVVLRFHNNSEKNELIKYCENNKYEFTICPRYIRVMENAISIEIKRL